MASPQSDLPPLRPPTQSVQFRSFPVRFLFFTVLVRVVLLLALIAALVVSFAAPGCGGGNASASGGKVTTDPLNPFKPVNPNDYEPPIAARMAADPALPALLSETGLFLDTAALAPAPDLRPMAVDQVALWIGTKPQQAWILATEPNDPALSTPGTIMVLHWEAPDMGAVTWVLVRAEVQWARYMYQWTKAGNDALLLPVDAR